MSGGGLGPVLLMFGLASGTAGRTSLLLNLEGVLTALLAWFVFCEHVDTRIAVGMGLITAGALALAWEPGHGFQGGPAALLVGAACLAWAVDNNLTRKVSGGDPTLIAALKGGAAGAANLTIAIAGGASLPALGSVVTAAAVGFLGYGVSLVLFVRALRELGAARTGAYFSTAPFLGPIASIGALGEPFTARLMVAGALMGAGVWLHITEYHGHEHAHERLEHEHLHRPDAHHQHAHEPGIPSGEPHSHKLPVRPDELSESERDGAGVNARRQLRQCSTGSGGGGCDLRPLRGRARGVTYMQRRERRASAEVRSPR